MTAKKMVDMAWRDAMAVCAIAGSFTREEREAGWPMTMQPEQMAVMQRPFLSGDVQGKRLAQALRDALQAACQGQAIACESEVRRVMTRPAVDHVPSRASMFGRVENWPEAYTRDGCAYAYTTPAKYEDRTFYRVTAAAFAAWLSAQGVEPSQHIAAWFKAQGLGAASATAAPGVPLAAEDVKTFEDLVRYRLVLAGGQKLKTAPPWPAHHVALVAARLQQEWEQGRERGAVGRIAQELCSTRQALDGVLKRHGYSPTTGQAQPKRLQRADAMGAMAGHLKTGTTGR